MVRPEVPLEEHRRSALRREKRRDLLHRLADLLGNVGRTDHERLVMPDRDDHHVVGGERSPRHRDVDSATDVHHQVTLHLRVAQAEPATLGGVGRSLLSLGAATGVVALPFPVDGRLVVEELLLGCGL